MDRLIWWSIGIFAVIAVAVTADVVWFKITSMSFDVTFVGFAVAVLVALLTVRGNQKIAKRQATVNFIAQNEIGSAEWPARLVRFWEITSKSSSELVDIVTDRSKEVSEVTAVLNHMELVAIAIRNHSLDEEIYKQWHAPIYVGMWDRSSQFVEAFRRHRNASKNAFIEFENLAKRWRPETLP